MSFDASALMRAVRAVVAPGSGSGAPKVALHEPVFGGREWEYVKDCLDTGWVSSVGEYVTRFERDVAAATGAAGAVAVANGTAALHVCLRLAGVEPGEGVLVPTLTFVATANAVRYCFAEPIFVDSERATLGMDPVALAAYLRRDFVAGGTGGGVVHRASGRRVRAFMPMHTFGHPVRMAELLEVGREFGLALVEDAAESLGSRIGGKPTGALGRIGALSFNGNKVVTTGGGGAIVSQDAELLARAKHLTTTARLANGWEFVHDEVGYNYRMPNLNAALGCAQLERLPEFLLRKRALAQRYAAALAEVAGAEFVREPAGTESNYWLNAVLVGNRAERDVALRELNAAGFMARPVWELMHRLPMYRESPRAPCPVAEDLADRIVNLPSGAALPLGAES